jgi:DNA ligase-1
MLDVIRAIARTQGSLSKMVMLKAHPELKRVVLYAYDPYKHYFMTEPALDGEGDRPIDDLTFQILDSKAKRELSTSAVYQYICSLDYEAAEVFKRILNKDLRMGLGVKSINKVWPGLIPTFSVQLAKLYEPSRVSFPCFVSPKLDGIRAIYKKGALYTRNGHTIQGVDHILEQCKIGLPLDGELLIPGMTFEESSGQLRSGNPSPNAVYYVFDSPGPDDLLTRLYTLSDLNLPNVQLVKHDEANSHRAIMEAYHRHREEGYEGSIVKKHDAPYYDGRNYDWMKIKNVDTHDCPVIGFYEGEGKYERLLGGIIIDYYGVPVRVGSGFNDTERSVIWNDQDYYLGKIAEIHAQEETNGKSLRHPRFKGWRWDKHE